GEAGGQLRSAAAARAARGAAGALAVGAAVRAGRPEEDLPGGAGMRAMEMAQLRRATAASERAAWRAAADAALRTLAAAAVSAALSVGCWQAWRWVVSAPLFALQQIHFAGLTHAREEDLIARSGLSLGENIFRADLSRAARSIQGHPWVAGVQIERRLPGT